MSAYTISLRLKKHTSKKSLTYGIIPNISICCDIDKSKLLNIIQFTFTQKGYFSVFGYNTNNEEFWGKKYIKNEFILHFTLTIKSTDYENSNIIINPIIGSDEEIKKLVFDIKEMINLYKNSNFIKHCVDEIEYK